MYFRPLISFVIILLITHHCLADGLEQNLALEIGETYTIQNNYFERGEGGFTRDEGYNLLYVTPSFSWTPHQGLHLFGSVDFVWQSPTYTDFIDSDNSEQFTFGGVTRNGVIAPGITLTVQPVEAVILEASVASLYAQKSPSNGDRYYGYEINAGVSLKVMQEHEIFLQAARFEHGDFFRSWQESGESLDPAFQFVIGGRLAF
jgi:hypothetical protein